MGFLWCKLYTSTGLLGDFSQYLCLYSFEELTLDRQIVSSRPRQQGFSQIAGTHQWSATHLREASISHTVEMLDLQHALEF